MNQSATVTKTVATEATRGQGVAPDRKFDTHTNGSTIGQPVIQFLTTT